MMMMLIGVGIIHVGLWWGEGWFVIGVGCGGGGGGGGEDGLLWWLLMMWLLLSVLVVGECFCRLL